MSGAATDPRFMGDGPPRQRLRLSWSDPRLRAIVWQVVVVGIVVAILWYLIGNTNRNLAARHIVTGFAFLFRTAGFPIGESVLPYDPAINTYGYALAVGVLNTLRVAVVGVVLATILGTFIGILRLSSNWLLARLAALYVELLRDIPVLLQLLFWYELLGHLPAPRRAFHPARRRLSLQSRHQAALHRMARGGLVGGARARDRHRRRRRLRACRPAAAGGDRQPRPGLARRAAARHRPARRHLGRAPPAAPLRHPRFARLQLPGRRHGDAGICGAADRPRRLHRRLYRRDRARRPARRAAGPMGSRRRARPPAPPHPAPDRAAAIAPRHHPADDEPVSQPHQEQLARRRDRLSRARLRRRHHAEPDGPGDRGHRHRHGRVPRRSASPSARS